MRRKRPASIHDYKTLQKRYTTIRTYVPSATSLPPAEPGQSRRSPELHCRGRSHLSGRGCNEGLRQQ